MSEKRRDNRNRILREGEYQRTDGRYRYRYIDEDGKEKNVYSWRLDKNDPTPKGKKRELSLREKENRFRQTCLITSLPMATICMQTHLLFQYGEIRNEP